MKLVDLTAYPRILYDDLSDEDVVARAEQGGELPLGQFAFAIARGTEVRLARDPLGCNKLFFGRDPDGCLVVANRLVEVWRRGVSLDAIFSCPPGHVISVSSEGVRHLGGTDIFNVPPDPQFSAPGFQEAVHAQLDKAFAAIARDFAGSQFVVCLSGGLDSSVVASFAAAHLPGVAAASFSYLSPEDFEQHRGGPVGQFATASEDFCCAERVATALGMRFLPVMRLQQDVESVVGTSVEVCQDWRDFNVHCATVNLFLAQDIRKAFPDRKVVVLTGDLMNEYVCDYHDEQVDQTIYYKVPKIPLDKRRKYFVRGLDAGDREVGVFATFGLIGCQPFVSLANQYLRIPAQMLEAADIKWTLNGSLLSPAVVTHVNRAKTRAQVGGSDLGTLGIYHRLGIGDEQLRNAWRAQFPNESRSLCDSFIEFGRYKSPRYVS